jgi:beta-N-acetylhexosaminidase
MLDVRQPGASDIVGDRAPGSEPMQVARSARRSSTGCQAGALGVIKHIPGHGRAWSTAIMSCRWSRRAREELAVDLETFEHARGSRWG